MPWPKATDYSVALIWLVLAVVALAAGALVYRWRDRLEEQTGRSGYPLIYGAVVAIAIGALAWLVLSLASGSSPFYLSISPKSFGPESSRLGEDRPRPPAPWAFRP